MGDSRGRAHPLGWRRGTRKRAAGDLSRIINVYQVEHDIYKDAYLKIPNTRTDFMEISVVENLTTSLGSEGIRTQHHFGPSDAVGFVQRGWPDKARE